VTVKKPTNDLVSRLGTPSLSPYANRCSVGLMMETLTDEERQAVESALEKVTAGLKTKSSVQTGYTARWFSKVLEEAGHHVSDRMVRRHCHGECSCES
jgi:hypothetical protein